MAAGTWRFQGCLSVKQVKLLAIREGLKLPSQFGFLRVQVETDSVEAVELCKSYLVDLSNIGFIVTDIQELLTEFLECTFSYIPCACNSVAYCLVKLSLVEGASVNWFEEPPNAFRVLLNQDMYAP